MNLYLTADRIGTETGGGSVTKNESDALRSLGPCEVVGRNELEQAGVNEVRFDDPWSWDHLAKRKIYDKKFGLCHIYSGTMTETVESLQDRGCKVIYTVAAHSIDASRREHEKFGIPYAKLYPHLCEPELWRRYSGGYWLADAIVVPSVHSRDVVNEQHQELFGKPCRRVEIIPHGCHVPTEVRPPPKRFVVGYMGASITAPDKGVVYLLQAWKKLNYKDSLLILAGRDSDSEPVRNMVRQFGGGSVSMIGWVDDVADYYGSINLAVQPSATEGFGMEVVEAMAHGRAVLCSKGAGACDLVDDGAEFDQCSVDALATALDAAKGNPLWMDEQAKRNRAVSFDYSWDKIKQQYVELWRSVL